MSRTDHDLVRRFIESGDTEAFEALVRRHLGQIRRLLLVMLPASPEDREDVEQEVLADLYLSLRRIRFRASFRTYLFRFCRNTTADFVRKRVRSRRRGHIVRIAAIAASVLLVVAQCVGSSRG